MKQHIQSTENIRSAIKLACPLRAADLPGSGHTPPVFKGFLCFVLELKYFGFSNAPISSGTPY